MTWSEKNFLNYAKSKNMNWSNNTDSKYNMNQLVKHV
jgi:hypothetical protein